MIYGDLDVSILNELPPGRQKIDTFAVPSSYHERIYAFLRKLVAEGRQAYIVCPMVSENDELPDERKAVTAYAEMLQKEVFPDLRIAPIHGKMKPKEKDGRVGRGRHKSYCVLVSDNKGEENKQRLKVMSSTSDGFAIAEEDLKLRGPGDFFGSRQHGLPSLRVADLSCDLSLLHETQSAAEQLLAADPALKNHPLLRARVELLFELNADAMN